MALTEEVAERLGGVSRQTISKWETDETLPDIRQSKSLAVLYHLSRDELIEFDIDVFDIDVKEIQEVIDKTSDEVTAKINWTDAWSKKYPILATYQNTVEVNKYAKELERLLDNLQKEYGYHELDTFLVLKDILASVWKNREK